MRLFPILSLLAAASTTVAAVTPAELERQLATAAAEGGKPFAGFSAERGQRLFAATHGND